MSGTDAHRLPFPDASFDVVTCLEFLEHTERPEMALSEMRRVLRAGGELIASTPYSTPYWDKIVWPLWERTFGKTWYHTHVNVMTGRQFRAVVEKAGFRVDRHVVVCFCDQIIRATRQ